MPDRDRTICIAGAGLAGLSMALALAKFGMKVMVAERATSPDPFGAGIQITPNARRILDALGLSKPLKSLSFEPEGIELYQFGSEKSFHTLSLGQSVRARFGTPYSVMHRADLADALYAACRRFANIDIRFGAETFEFKAGSGDFGVNISGPEFGKTELRPFAFIGADGVHSATRINQRLGQAPVYSGYVAWRALVDMAELQGILSMSHTSLMLGPGFHAVAYPLIHRGAFNIAIFAPEPTSQILESPPPTGPHLPKKALSDPRFGAILRAAADKWTFWPLATADASLWYRGPIGLIGDAAHAMLPFQAQGAAMAIEDVAVLAPLMASESDPAAAWARYAELRQARVRRVAEVSRNNGNTFHMGWPWSLARDLTIKVQGPEAHLDRLAWLYGYDAASVPTADQSAA